MAEPIPIELYCPALVTDPDGRQRMCGFRHIDRGEFATKPHHTHSCQHCGHSWRPAIIATVGVQFLPGFKDAALAPSTSPDEGHGSLTDRLLRALAQSPGTRIRELACGLYGDANKASQGKVRSLLCALAKQGRTIRVGPGEWRVAS